MLGDETQLLIEPIVGWRGWGIEDVYLGKGLGWNRTGWTAQLTSPQQGDTWDAGTLRWDGACKCDYSQRERRRAQLLAMQATIAQIESGEIEPPALNIERYTQALYTTCECLYELIVDECHCGINAFATAEQMDEAGYRGDDKVRIVGQVELSGLVRGFERGWRGETGRAVRLWAAKEQWAQYTQIAAEHAGAQFMGVWDEEEAAHAR